MPNTGLDLNFNAEIQTSRTHGIDFEKNIVNGFVDGIDAVKQAVFLILNTNRFEHIIYDNNYGSELTNLIGKNTSDIEIHILQAVEDALFQDDRIKSISDFVCQKNKEKITASFTVNSIFGSFPEQITV